MSVIKINVSTVIGSGSLADSAKTVVSSQRSRIRSVGGQIDGRIRGTNGISSRLDRVYSDLRQAESRIGNLKNVVEKCAIEYKKADMQIKKLADSTSDFPNPDASKAVGENFLSKLLKTKSEKEWIEDSIKGESKILKALSKLIEDKEASNDLKLTSSALSYIASLYTFYNAEYNDTSDRISGGLKIVKSSTSMWDGVYKYLEKSLKTMDAARFGKKYQAIVGGVSLVGSLSGLTGSAINSFKILTDKNSKGYEKISAILKNTSSASDVTQSIANLKWGQKVLSRDIHAKYQWGVAAKNAPKLDKVSTVTSVLGVVADTGIGAVNKYGEVSADGFVDSRDFAEIGISGSVHGLTSVVSGLTFGVSDVIGLSDSADAISDGIVNFADTKGVDFATSHRYSSEYVKNTKFLADYADNPENNAVLRVGASAVAGTGMIGAMAVDGISEGCSWVGNKISDGWQSIKNIF